MRRIILIVPDLVGEIGQDSGLRQKLPGFRQLAERGDLVRIAPIPKMETPEALYLGARRGEIELKPGPLIVSALGFDPPERSLHFCLTPISIQDGALSVPNDPMPPEDEAELMRAAKRLDTSTLTVLAGESLEHALVLEGRGDMETTSANATTGKEYRSCLPVGDHEVVLRRFLDDSVNLLSENPVNLRRLDQGLSPFNLLWPWGEGRRTAVPNLAIRRGERAVIESGSLRLAGLSRLTGDQHLERAGFGKGLQTQLKSIGERTRSRPLSIVVVDAMTDLVAEGLEEERHWFVRELDKELLTPLLDTAHDEPVRIVLVAPSHTREGLAVRADLPRGGNGKWPFDERSLEERTVSRVDLDAVVRQAIFVG